MRFNVFLAVLLVACALSVVTSQNEARKLFRDIEDEKTKQSKLETEYLTMERVLSDLSNINIIEVKARQHLNMYVPLDSRQSETTANLPANAISITANSIGNNSNIAIQPSNKVP